MKLIFPLNSLVNSEVKLYVQDDYMFGIRLKRHGKKHGYGSLH